MTKPRVSSRVRFSGVDQVEAEESGNVTDRRIPLQKTQSFKEKKKTDNWLQRRYSGNMNEDYDSIVEIEHATAVAAAAFAVKSIEQAAISENKRTVNETGGTLTKIKSNIKEETTVSKPEAGRLSKLFSAAGFTNSTQNDQSKKVPISTSLNDKMPQKTTLPASSFKRSPTSDAILPASSFKRSPTSDAILPAPPMRKAPTFADKELNSSTSSIKPGTSTPKLDMPTIMKPATPANDTDRRSAARPRVAKTMTDEWEEAEMAKLNKRYEQQNTTILSWENKKKKKSKLRLGQRESDIEKRRMKALAKYNNEMEYIKQIAEGARAQAEGKRKTKELKVKDKANTLRRTGGESSTTCGCF